LPVVVLVDGYIRLPEKPGLGLELNAEKIQSWTVPK
jgi:L-alanine-DL-glutamate epimerase-like enolase superfamily enzyme